MLTFCVIYWIHLTVEFGYNESVYEEDEGETSTYYLGGGFDGNKSSKFTQKKRKNLMKSHNVRSYELGADVPYGNYSNGSHQSMLLGKRPANSLNVGYIPTKRIRTASRQRVVSTFGAGAAGSLQVPAKTDASSGDTNSFQDDQSTLHGGFHIQKSMEVESAGEFEKQLPYDCAETSAKPKKKKKPKHLVSRTFVYVPTCIWDLSMACICFSHTSSVKLLELFWLQASAFDQGWQLDSNVHNEQVSTLLYSEIVVYHDNLFYPLPSNLPFKWLYICTPNFSLIMSFLMRTLLGSYF